MRWESTRTETFIGSKFCFCATLGTWDRVASREFGAFSPYDPTSQMRFRETSPQTPFFDLETGFFVDKALPSSGTTVLSCTVSLAKQWRFHVFEGSAPSFSLSKPHFLLCGGAI